jgi:FkbH-like protein
MGLDYLTWLADLERPTTNALEAGPLAIQLHPAGAELPALTCLVQRLARRFVAEYPEQALTRRRVAVVVSMAAGSAPAVYGGGRHAAAALAAEVRELAVEAGRAADAVLVQTLPFGACGDVVDEANSAITAAVREAGVEVVAVHRVATFDAFVAAEDFAAAADALRALGRHERIGFLWNMLVDAAWAHWQVLVPATAAPKVIATDLDGVLWAGTIAEDGIDAALNGGGPLTRLSHAVWRTHLRRSASRGVLVAALSKNSADQAEIALRRLNPPLGTAGVWACEQIDKAAAVGEMLASFDGVAPAHLVLVDDNPGQQELLRAAWPQATVPAVAAPLLVADLLRQVPIGRGPVTSSDRQRGAYYKAKASGQLVPEVTCLVDPDDPAVVDRLAQLHARTNQFNMTSPRRDVGQLHDLIADPHWSVVAFRVAYHGSTIEEEIVGCAEIHYTRGEALLDSFLASCRLLWAGAQQRMFDQVRATARTQGYERLTARWRPNGRNEAYSRWFAHIGWSEPADDGTGLCFCGTTATRDGQAPADLLAVMSRYLATKAHDVYPPRPIAYRLRAADDSVEVRVPSGRYRPGLSPADIDVVRAVFGVDPIGELACDPVAVAGFLDGLSAG